MYTIILALHIFVCFLLIIAVLLQNSKGSDIGSALGGGSGEMFGPRAPANVMNKITTVIAASFLILSLTLAIISKSGSSPSLLRDSRNIPQTDTLIETPIGITDQKPIQLDLENSNLLNTTGDNDNQ